MSRKLILLAILAVIGTAELLVMVVFYYLGIRAGWLESLVDTAVLVAISAPLLHLVLLRSERSVREGKELARAYQSLKGLYDLADALKQATNEQDVLNNTLQQVMKFPGIQAGWVSLREGETGFRLAAAYGLPPALEVPGAFEGECLCRRKLLAGELDRTTIILECERLRQAKGDTRGLRLHASVPLWIGNRVIGVMNLAGPEQGLFGDKDLEILYSVGNQVAVALERTHLLHQMEKAVEERTAALTAEIAERKRTQKNLTDALHYAQKIVETAPIGVITYKASGEAVDANLASTELVGGDVERLRAQNFRHLESWRRSGLLALAEAALANGAPCHGEVHATSTFSKQFWVNAHFVPFTYGDEPHLLALFEDVSERKRVEENLREKENLLSQSQRIAHIGGWSFNVTTQSLIWTDQTYLIYGVSRDTFTPSVESLIGLIHPDDRCAMQEWIGAAAADHSGGVLEFRTVWPDGSIHIISSQGEIVSHKGTEPSVLMGTAQDITERKLLENQLRQAQKMEAVGRLAGGVAHDFNNLLGVIIGYSELVEERLKPDDSLRPKIEEIKKAGQRGAALTRQLLVFSRQQVLELKILNLNSVVEDVQTMLQRVIGEDIELVMECTPNLGLVKADRGQIEQVIMNLAVNARDAMPNGGKLRIETANVDLDKFYARQHTPVVPGSYVMLVVTDTGIGMDAETQTHIFEPFFTTKALGKGTGLGLATVYGIVKQSGGYVWVYSELGQGTTFKIYLPQVQGEAEKEQPSIGPDKLVKGTETILLVEDEEALRKMTRELLEESGYTVLEASDGLEALEIARQHKGPIHLLLTDVVMPRMSGPALAKPAAVLHPELKVLYMSGYTGHSDVGRTLLSSESELLQKPFTRDALLRKMREVLGV